MDTLILGLLMIRDFTVYEIQGFLKKGMYLMYSSSMGSIQAAVKKLMTNGYAGCTQKVENGKNKKVYSITSAGRQYFLQWISEPMKAEKMQNIELSKLFFMGFAQKEKREELVQGYIASLEEKLQTLQQVQQSTNQVLVEEPLQEIAFFQHATIQYAIDSAKFELQWYKQFCAALNNRGATV